MFGKLETFNFTLYADDEALSLLWTVDYEKDLWGYPAPHVSWVEFKSLGAEHFKFVVETYD